MAGDSARIDVLLVTYNHERYVAQALDSIFYQVPAGALRVVVADDFSSDSTVAIVRDNARRHPNVDFMFLDTTRNLGITANYQRGFAACTAEFVAVLEGDDYWCSPHKLRKQAAFLDEHRDCAMCGCNYLVLDEGRATSVPRVAVAEGFDVIDSRALIHDNVIGTFSTCMYRGSALRKIPPELYSMKSYDWVVNICVGMHGLIGFLREPLSVYRIHGRGSWSMLSQAERIEVQLALIPKYDLVTNGVYHDEFVALKRRLTRAKLMNTAQRLRVWRLLRRAKALLVALSPPGVVRLARKAFLRFS